MPNVRIVTDSTADIPPEFVARYNITVVPAVVIVRGRQYLDGEGLSRADFYRRLPEMNPLPTTAAPSAGVFAAAYRAALAEADAVVGIFLASTLSSIYQNARVAAEMVGGRVHVVDSGQLTLGLGFQVLAAARVAAEGGSVEDVMAVYDRLMQLRADIESLQGQLNRLEKLVAFSTISLHLEPSVLSKPIEGSGWHPLETIRSSLDTLVDVLAGLATLFIQFVIVVLPVLVILAIPFALLIWIINRWQKRRRANRKTQD